MKLILFKEKLVVEKVVENYYFVKILYFGQIYWIMIGKL